MLEAPCGRGEGGTKRDAWGTLGESSETLELRDGGGEPRRFTASGATMASNSSAEISPCSTAMVFTVFPVSDDLAATSCAFSYPTAPIRAVTTAVDEST